MGNTNSSHIAGYDSSTMVILVPSGIQEAFVKASFKQEHPFPPVQEPAPCKEPSSSAPEAPNVIYRIICPNAMQRVQGHPACGRQIQECGDGMASHPMCSSTATAHPTGVTVGEDFQTLVGLVLSMTEHLALHGKRATEIAATACEMAERGNNLEKRIKEVARRSDDLWRQLQECRDAVAAYPSREVSTVRLSPVMEARLSRSETERPPIGPRGPPGTEGPSGMMGRKECPNQS